jgi:hypothetical protein
MPRAGDVGRDQHLVSALLESFERLRPLRLRAVAVDPLDADLVRGQVLGQPVGAVLRPREDQRVLTSPCSSFSSSGAFSGWSTGYTAWVMPGRRRRAPLEVDRDRVVQHLLRQLRDRRRHRRAEEERLPLLRDVPQHAADVGQEAHVEHRSASSSTRNSMPVSFA